MTGAGYRRRKPLSGKAISLRARQLHQEVRSGCASSVRRGEAIYVWKFSGDPAAYARGGDPSPGGLHSLSQSQT